MAGSVEQYALPEEAVGLEAPSYRSRGIWRGDDAVSSIAVPEFRLSVRALFERQANLAALAASGV